MKPISSVLASSSNHSKPHLPPKPIKYRTTSTAAAAAVSCGSTDPQPHLFHLITPQPPRILQFDQEPLSFPRSQIPEGGPSSRPRHPRDQPSRIIHPTPREPQTDPRCDPAPKNIGVGRGERAFAPDPRSNQLMNSSAEERRPRHVGSRSNRVKLLKKEMSERTVGQSVQQSTADLNAHQSLSTPHSSANAKSPSVSPSVKPLSLATSPSVVSNSGSSPVRQNADDLEPSVTSPVKPNRTSSCADSKQTAIVTSSATDVTSSRSVYTRQPMTSSVTSSSSSSKHPTTSPVVTSSSKDAGGSDVIYDEPSVDLEWKKSLERMVLSDGYVRVRSDGASVVEVESVEGKREGGESEISCKNSRNNRPDLLLLHHPMKSVGGMRSSHSSESLDRLESMLDFSDCVTSSCVGGVGGVGGRVVGSKAIRSSFVDPNGPPTRRSVYIELGEYQTLLKHSRNDDDDEECRYSLPQPLCYSEDTLKAVKLITQKYDTFKRRQLRALSFRDGTQATTTNQRKSSSEGLDQHHPPPNAPPVGDESAESNNNKSNGDCSVHAAGVATTPAPVQHTTPAEPETKRDDVKTGSTVVETRSKPSQSILLLRDYCNTLEAGVDSADASGSGLSKLNLMRVELFYRSQEASVFVCRCLADLFVGASVGEVSPHCPLVHQHTGVPVWVLNSGEGVRGRDLLLVLAERETGFPLWQDKINYLSNYVELSPGVHSLRVSGSLRKSVRLDMFCQRAAAEFMVRFREVTADPNDDLWKISCKDASTKGAASSSSRRKSGGQATTKKKKKTKRKRSRISKTSISHPCNFVHISRVDPTDANFRAAFSDLIPLRSGRSPTDCKDPDSSKDPDKASDSSKDPDKASNAIKDHDKVTDSVYSAQQKDNSESAADHDSVCEFRPRLPTR